MTDHNGNGHTRQNRLPSPAHVIALAQPAAGSGASAMLEAVGKLVEAAAEAGTGFRLSLRAGGLQISIGPADNAEAFGAGGLPVMVSAASLIGLSAKHLRQIERKLLQAATHEPLPAKKIIVRAGYTVSTYSREAITSLVRAGLLLRDADGLRQMPIPVAEALKAEEAAK